MITLEYRNFSLQAGSNPVLDRIDLSMAGPGVWALLGPSGAGKSSLLRTTQRLIDRGPGNWCRSGQILFNGQEIHRSDLKRRALARSIGYIQQNPRVLGGSIRANVAFALKHTTRLSRKEIAAKVADVLEQVGLTKEVPDLDMAAWKLSGGQIQRLAIARAIALDPMVMLMDEPTSALDPVKSRKLEAVIRKLAKSRLVVLVTHDVQLAGRIADHACFLFPGPQGGRINASGPVPAILEHCDDRATVEFVKTGSHEGVVGNGPWPSSKPLMAAVDGPISDLVQKAILFVCGGNTSRSPMAQVVCNSEIIRKWGRAEGSRFKVHSAGLSPEAGAPLEENARIALAQLGLSAHKHRAQAIDETMVRSADVIYCMTDKQCRSLANQFPWAEDRVQRLDPISDLMNPHGGDLGDLSTGCR